MKKIYSILISLLLIFLPLSSAFAANIPDIEDKNFCVVDDADVISQETENYLSALNYDLNNKTGASIVIATVDFTGSLSIDEYAYQAFNKWGVGDKDKDNGLLVLMSVGDEDYWAVQGSGLEKDLSSGEISQMLYDYMEEDFAKGDYDAAAKSIYLAAYEWFGDFYNIPLITDPSTPAVDDPGTDTGEPVTDDNNTGDFMMKLITWIVIIAIVIIILSALTGGNNQPKKRAPKKVQRRGPHTSSYRRYSHPTYTQPKRTVIRVPFIGSSGRTSSTNRSSSGRSVSSRSTSGSSTRSSSTSRSSSGRSGGFGGGSTRGGGAGRRK
ncbi:MAG: TPM domain-containing protein [Anaerofustis stercorihominis]|nr:TPM domain-containing protein [Anaerofustis stercorihominis]